MSERSTAQLAQEAIDVQNAANLRGVLSSWHRALCAVGHGSPEELNLNALYLSKVTSLLVAYSDGIGGIIVRHNNLKAIPEAITFCEAYDWAKREASK